MVSVWEGAVEWPLGNWTSGCGAGCRSVAAPPPDTILEIPPPPLPHFLHLAAPDAANGTGGGAAADGGFVPPCNPHCAGSGGAAGVEFVELSHRGVVGAVDDTWFLVLVGASVAFVLLGALLAVALLRWRQRRNMKNQMEAAAKVRPLDGGGHCCGQGSEQHALWAALTSKGTPAHFTVPHRHGVDFCRPSAPGFGYYGAIEPHLTSEKYGRSQPGTPDSQIYTEIPDVKMMTRLPSYDDFGYEDVAASMAEARHHTLGHYGARPLVSPPTKIDASGLPPLNQKRQRNPPNI